CKLLAVTTLSSGSVILLLAVGSSFWQWELSNHQWECLVHFIPNIEIMPPKMRTRSAGQSAAKSLGGGTGVRVGRGGRGRRPREGNDERVNDLNG
nr:hypothetical protein [Tanacetum cinerariifolium]